MNKFKDSNNISRFPYYVVADAISSNLDSLKANFHSEKHIPYFENHYTYIKDLMTESILVRAEKMKFTIKVYRNHGLFPEDRMHYKILTITFKIDYTDFECYTASYDPKNYQQIDTEGTVNFVEKSF